MTRTDDTSELVQRYLDGDATEDEVRALSKALEAEPDLRARFLAYARLDASLSKIVRSQAAPIISNADSTNNRRSRKNWWSLSTAAVIGLVVGLLSASAVWALTLPAEGPAEVVAPLLEESFENSDLVPGHGFPTVAGTWSGDLLLSSKKNGGVVPKSGSRVAELPPHPKRKFSYATRIIDLDDVRNAVGDGTPRVEVEASFRAPESVEAMRHQIRLAAFAESPAEVKARWVGGELFDWVLQHVARTVTVRRGAGSEWHTLTTTMEIPPNARSLVISLAAATPDESAPKSAFYLDDVDVRLFVRPRP